TDIFFCFSLPSLFPATQLFFSLSLPSTETNNPLVSFSLSLYKNKKKKKQKGRIEEEEDAGSRRTRRRRNPHPTPPHLCSPSLFSLLSDVVSFSLCDLKSPKSPMKRQTCQGRRVIRRLVG
ncbi:unnamed protein product, partial [Linum tenue]